MAGRFLNERKQIELAKSISPIFAFLAKDPGFVSEAQKLRGRFGISTTNPRLIGLLWYDFWNMGFDDAALFEASYSTEEISVWQSFHLELERVARAYRLGKFPNLIKKAVIEGYFPQELFATRISIGFYEWTASGSMDIKKSDFEKIWKTIQEQKRKNEAEYPDIFVPGPADKIRSLTVQSKVANLLIKERLYGCLTYDEERRLNLLDKSQKSRLKSTVDRLFEQMDSMSGEFPVDFSQAQSSQPPVF